MRRFAAVLIGIIILIAAVDVFAGDCGDVNNDSNVDILDIVYLINYKYKSGPEPISMQSADVNADGNVDILDIVYLINYKYKSGPVPDCGIVIDIDGNVYGTVTIGGQVWMAENLKVTHYRNGDAVPNVTDNAAWSGLNSGAYCNYNNDINNVATYGRFYNWYAVVDSRNIAPAGWHIPTDAEWKQLEMYLGMSQAQADAIFSRGTTEGGKMKEAGTMHWFTPNIGATNESGFSALPGGYRETNGHSDTMGSNAFFWSSTEFDSGRAWYRHLSFSGSQVYRNYDDERFGFSVRCVRD